MTRPFGRTTSSGLTSRERSPRIGIEKRGFLCYNKPREAVKRRQKNADGEGGEPPEPLKIKEL